MGPDVGVDHEGYEWALASRWYRHGILRCFDTNDPTLPVAALSNALSRRPDLVHTIHHRKMEELVASVMTDYMGKCEVELCGRSGDGGIDLILVLSDAPLAVQVKRRTKPGSVESVEAVRMFLAAMQIRGVTGGLFVTTADHFSRQAHNVAAQAVTLGLVSRFDLIDRHRFFTMIGATRSDGGVPDEWRQHIEYSPW